jgi:hypothetical protein
LAQAMSINKKMHVVTFVTFTAIAAGAIPTATFAQAQNNFARDENIGVTERARPDYDAIGVPVSTFLLFPRIDLSAIYDDNILATDTNKQNDFIAQIEPSLNLKSQWSRHELDATAYAKPNFYASHSNENTTDYGAGLNGRLDVLTGTSISGQTSYDRLTESSKSEGFSRNTVKPVQYDLWNAGATAVHQFNRLQVSLGGAWNRYRYSDGVNSSGAVVDETYRDVDNYTETLRADYALSPDTAVFVSGNLNQNSYVTQPPLVPYDRDGHGYEILGGVNFQLSQLVQGEVGAGYLSEEYPHVPGQDYRNLAFHALVHWYPSELTTVTLKADRVAYNSQDARSGGYISTGGSLKVDHELRWNVILNLDLSYNSDDHQGIDRVDNRWRGAVGGTYLVSRNVGLALNFSHDSVDSTGADRYISFQDNTVMLSLILQQ